MRATTINPTDRHVALRIKARRVQMGVSQQTLANELGITFQQVQKYEQAKNRVSAGRLSIIARILQCTVADFFDGAPVTFEAGATTVPLSDVDRFITSRQGHELVTAFSAIRNNGIKDAIVQMAKAAAETAEAA